jgi:hypothetical protein
MLVFYTPFGYNTSVLGELVILFGKMFSLSFWVLSFSFSKGQSSGKFVASASDAVPTGGGLQAGR